MPIPTTPNYFSLPFPTFQPAQRNILSITQSFPAVVTTTFDGTSPGDNQYTSGMIVSFRIPYMWGMTALDTQQAVITVISPSSFSVPIDTTLYEPFVVPTGQPSSYATPAQVVNVGEINDNLRGSVQNVLPYPLGPLNPIE